MEKQAKSRKSMLVGVIVAVVVLAALLALLLTQCFGGQSDNTTPSDTAGTTAPADQVIDLYWNVDRLNYIDTTNPDAGVTNRPIHEDGYYHVIFAHNGEQIDLPIAERRILTRIDAGDLMTLVFDENGVVVDATLLENLPVEILGAGWYLQSMGGKTVKINSAQTLSGVETVFKYTEETEIYDMSGKSEFIGAKTKLQRNDRLTVIANADGDVVYIAILEREGIQKTKVAYCQHCKEEVTWENWFYAGKAPEDNGHYYLETDIQLSGQVNIQESCKLCLDLNGYTITGKNNQRVYTTFNAASELAIMDNSEAQTGKVTTTGDNLDQGGLLWARYGVINVYSGTYDASKATSRQNGTAICVEAGAMVNMYGGKVIGGTAKLREDKGQGVGGSVCVRSSKIAPATFNMYGGEIVGGKAHAYGGNIGIFGERSTFNMYGGTLRGGTVPGTGGNNNGGNVVLYDKAVFNMSGGTIVGGVANKYGNVWCSYTGIFNMTGGTITGGKARNEDGTYNENESGRNVQVSDASFSMYGGRIDGYVNVVDGNPKDQINTTVYVSGSVIINGAAEGHNNLKLSSGVTFKVGKLSKNALIGVTVPKHGTFSANAVSAGTEKNFFSDRARYTIGLDADSKLTTLYDAEANVKVHCICGDPNGTGTPCAEEGHIQHKWYIWINPNAAPFLDGFWYLDENLDTSAGNHIYYADDPATEDKVDPAGTATGIIGWNEHVELSTDKLVQGDVNVYVDLNGFNIIGRNGHRIFRIDNNGTYQRSLTITDTSAEKNGTVIPVAGGNTDQGVIIWSAGAGQKVDIYAGIFDASKITVREDRVGGAAFQGVNFRMFGGKVIAGTALGANGDAINASNLELYNDACIVDSVGTSGAVNLQGGRVLYIDESWQGQDEPLTVNATGLLGMIVKGKLTAEKAAAIKVAGLTDVFKVVLKDDGLYIERGYYDDPGKPTYPSDVNDPAQTAGRSCICGADNRDGKHTKDCYWVLDSVWVEVSDEATFLSAVAEEKAYLRLTADVDLTATVTLNGVPKLAVDLNGFKLTQKTDKTRIFNLTGSDLTITDTSKDRTGALVSAKDNATHLVDGNIIAANNYCRIYVFGGTLDASASTGETALGIMLLGNGDELYFHGGEIKTGTSTTKAGGTAIYSRGKVYLTGGTITGCPTGNEGKNAGAGTINIDQGELHLSGDAKIIGAKSYNGAAIGLGKNTVMTMTDNAIVYGGTAVNYGGAINMSAGSSLTISDDAKIVGGEAIVGGAIAAGGANTVITMNGGTIEGGTANERTNGKEGIGGNVCVYEGATFTLNDGTIKDGKAWVTNLYYDAENPGFEPNGGNGGNVYVSYKGAFVMNGGTVTGGIASRRGGNFYVAGNTTLQINGGTVSDGKAILPMDITAETEIHAYNKDVQGGNIAIYGGTAEIGGDAKIIGGEANRGGNIFAFSGSLTVKDTAEVTGGVAKAYAYGGGAGCIQSDVSTAIKFYLAGAPVIEELRLQKTEIILNIAGLTKDAKIGFMPAGTGIFTTEADSADVAEAFELLRENYYIIARPDKTLEVALKGTGGIGELPTEPAEPRIRCMCGKVTELDADCADCGNKAIEWQPWTNTGKFPTKGNWYLYTNVTIGSTVWVGDLGGEVKMDLNGRTMTLVGAAQIYTFNNTLTVTDTAGEGKIIGGTSEGGIFTVAQNCVLNIYGGTFQGIDSATKAGSVIRSANKVNIYGGTFIGGKDSADKTICVSNGDMTIGGNTKIENGDLYVGGGSVSLSGTPVIEEITLVSGQRLNIAELEKAADIGITLKSGVGFFTNAAQNADVAEAFHSTNESYKIMPSTTLTMAVVDKAYTDTLVDNGRVPGEPEQPEGHIYCYCGKETTLDVVCDDCGSKAIKWEPWTNANKFPTKGTWYLDTDVTISATVWVGDLGGDIAIDLNGKTMTMSGAAQIYHYNRTLTITDIAGSGKIIGGTAQGGVVKVAQNCVLNIYGGTLQGVGSSDKTGGTIHLGNNSTINIYGGTIVGGTASCGGAINMESGALNIYGGTITSGTATDSGKCVYVGGGSVSLSGTPAIEEITLVSGQRLDIAALEKDANIGIMLKDGKGFFTNAAQSADVAEAFHSINDAYEVKASTALTLALVEKGTTDDVVDPDYVPETPDPEEPEDTEPRVRCMCGKVTELDADCADCGNKAIKWEPWTNANQFPTKGNWYLGTDVTIASTVWVGDLGGDIAVDLNGKTMTMSGEAQIYHYNRTLTITDIAGNGKIIGGTSQGSVVIVAQNAVLNIYGGTLQGVGSSNKTGGTIQLGNGSTINIYGGTIVGGTASRGGAIYIGSGALNIYGGTITSGTATDSGKCVYVAGANCTVKLSGEPVINDITLGAEVLLDITGLEKTAHIGVTPYNTTGAFTTAAASADVVEAFYHAAGLYDVKANASNAMELTEWANRVRCMCGKVTELDADCADCGNKAIEWKPWVDPAGLGKAPWLPGNWYLTKDLDLNSIQGDDATSYIGYNFSTRSYYEEDVTCNVDLNGFTVISRTNQPAFKSNGHGNWIYTLTVTDTRPSMAGKIVAKTTESCNYNKGYGIWWNNNTGVVNIYRATIDASGVLGGTDGGAFYGYALNLYDATIIGGKVNNGGAIYINSYQVDGKLSVHGGKIIGGDVTGCGNAVVIAYNTQCTLSGAPEIDDIYMVTTVVPLKINDLEKTASVGITLHNGATGIFAGRAADAEVGATFHSTNEAYEVKVGDDGILELIAK